MKLKTSELEGEMLNRAVAKCEGQVYHGPAWTKYSTDWAQGGPIIEREKIALYLNGEDGWTGEDGWKRATGPTPLIAAMRCYVAMKLGDEVEVSTELGETNAI
jgi:hypothetical protein